jgi:hypothetical protein
MAPLVLGDLAKSSLREGNVRTPSLSPVGLPEDGPEAQDLRLHLVEHRFEVGFPEESIRWGRVRVFSRPLINPDRISGDRVVVPDIYGSLTAGYGSPLLPRFCPVK